jgi:hypothetical protein
VSHAIEVYCEGWEVLTVVKTGILVFWVTMLYSLLSFLSKLNFVCSSHTSSKYFNIIQEWPKIMIRCCSRHNTSSYLLWKHFTKYYCEETTEGVMVVNVASMRELRNLYSILVRKLVRKRSLGRFRCKWMVTIKFNKGIECGSVD